MMEFWSHCKISIVKCRLQGLIKKAISSPSTRSKTISNKKLMTEENFKKCKQFTILDCQLKPKI